MYGFAVVAAVFIISLLAFPKYRLHIIAGSVVIGLLLYFTTDKDIRDGRRTDTDIRLKEISVQHVVLEWNASDSVFTGRLRNHSRQDLAVLDMRFVITACKTAGNDTADASQDEAASTSAEKRVLIHGVFYDALNAKDADIVAESQRWAQRRHLENTAMDCEIIDKSETSFTLPKALPRGREKDTAIPVSFSAPLPKDADISWYWGLTSARKMEDVQEGKNTVTIETEKPAEPEQTE